MRFAHLVPGSSVPLFALQKRVRNGATGIGMQRIAVRHRIDTWRASFQPSRVM